MLQPNSAALFHMGIGLGMYIAAGANASAYPGDRALPTGVQSVRSGFSQEGSNTMPAQISVESYADPSDGLNLFVDPLPKLTGRFDIADSDGILSRHVGSNFSDSHLVEAFEE